MAACASMIADQEGVGEKFQEAMAKEDEKAVGLGTRIPVRLLYHTAFLDSGSIKYRPDVYGWDDEVAKALGMAGGPARKKVAQLGDIGP